MKTYQAIIIDDEPKLQKVLQIKLEKFCPEIKISGFANEVKEAYKLIKSLKPQIIFLDISMPEETGFHLLEYFDSFDFEIIFVTGFSEYAIQALRLCAVDYLLKPVRTKLLVQAVNKAIENIEKRNEIERYKVLKSNLVDFGNSNNKIAIPGIDNYTFVKVNNIIHCEGWENYTKIHMENGDVLTSSYNIGVFKETLSHYKFYCCHKSHLINVNKIKSYNKEGTIVMSNKNAVPVSRRRKDEFVKLFVKSV